MTKTANRRRNQEASPVALSSTARFLLKRKPVWTDTYPGDLTDLWVEHIAPMGDILIHTTCYPHAVLNSNRIKRPSVGYQYVSLTRSPAFAEYWARNHRPDDEGFAAHLLLDRRKLQHRYKLETFRDPWNGSNGATGEHHYECEERIARDVFPLFDFMLGVVFTKARQ